MGLAYQERNQPCSPKHEKQGIGNWQATTDSRNLKITRNTASQYHAIQYRLHKLYIKIAYAVMVLKTNFEFGNFHIYCLHKTLSFTYQFLKDRLKSLDSVQIAWNCINRYHR